MYKKIIFLIIFFNFLLILFPKKIFADWTKYDGNPVLSTNENEWDKIHLASPAVIYDNQIFKMWYQGYDGFSWKIGYAESNDGINWKKRNNPVIIPSQINQNVIGVVEPTVLKVENIYKIWLNGFNSNYKYSIYYGESTDGISWNMMSEPVLTSDNNNWELSGPTNPKVIFDNNKYHMWYVASSQYNPWLIGYAVSNNGILWIKDNENPKNLPSLGFLGGMDVIKIKNDYYMFYHTGGQIYNWINYGIYQLKSTNLKNWSCINECMIIKIGIDGFDNNGITAPSVLFIKNRFFLWYSGYDGSHWQIGLATYTLEEERNPIILLPGLMASWNKSAIFYNQPVSIFDWKLLPFVKEYNGIINTLKNLGYQENQDFFIFPYDWRKSVDQSSEDLKTFIEAKIPQDKKVNLIGHSLGGLVARLFTQKNKDKVNKLITVGSPHQGAGQSYKAIEAGELETSNTWQWLGQKLLLQIYKDGIKTDKQIINEKLPVVKDLLPTYDFLKNINGETISINNMTIKNNTLLTYNSNINEIFSFLSTITGENNNQTIWGYKVGSRTIFDQILDYYPDGRPIETLYDIGDGTVISFSSKIGENKEIFNLNHGEIIYKKPAIKKILDILNLNYQDEQIVESQGTKITPSLIISLLSPATMSAFLNQSTYNEYDGLIFIENPQTGDYQLKVIGTDEGKYKVIIGQITDKGDYWESIENKTFTNKVDNYLINFNQENPKEFFVDEKNIEKIKEHIINELILINNPQNDNLAIAVKKLIKLKKPEEILIVHKHLFNALNEISQNKLAGLLSAINKLEYFYSLIAQKSKIKPKILENEIKFIEKKFNNLEKILLKRKNNNEILTYQLVFYQLTKEKINKTIINYQNKNYSFTEILLKSIEELIKKAITL